MRLFPDLSHGIMGKSTFPYVKPIGEENRQTVEAVEDLSELTGVYERVPSH